MLSYSTRSSFSVSIRKSGANVDESKLKWIMSQAFANQAQLNIFPKSRTIPSELAPNGIVAPLEFLHGVLDERRIDLPRDRPGDGTKDCILDGTHRTLASDTSSRQTNRSATTKRALSTRSHDRMPLHDPDHQLHPEDKERGPPSGKIDVLAQGRDALEAANRQMGLAFDEWDLNRYTTLFRDAIRRNPTRVECFDLAQSNSEHSRHWLFRGRVRIDAGEEKSTSLMKMVVETQSHSNANNVIAFSIDGYDVTIFQPERPHESSRFEAFDSPSRRHVVFTAETHNFPTGVAPFPGATTGTGGRIRDVQCVERGAHVIAGTPGYCFGNLHIPG